MYDASGGLVTTLAGGKRRGLNRVEWPMRSRAPRMAPGIGIIPSVFSLLGPRVLEGTYAVKLVRGTEMLASEILLVPDPRSPHTAADRVAQRDTALKLYGLVERLASLVSSLDGVRNQTRARLGTLPAGDTLATRLGVFAAALDDERAALVSVRQGEGISADEKLREELGLLYGNVNGYEGRPTESQVRRMAVLAKQLDEAIARFERLVAADLPALNADLAARKMDGITVKGGR